MSSARSSVLRPRHTPRRHVLVTGADGFIGGYVARALSSVGHTVTGVVFGRAAGEGEVRLDLTVPGQLSALPHGVDAVVHAAGVVDPRAAHAMAAVNVGGTAALTAWSRAQRVGHFVQLSSVAVYGPLVLGRDRSEEAPRLGLALGLPYMRTKARAERVVAAAQVPYTLIRPPAVLGPGDTVITPGFVAALTGAGIPLLGVGSLERRAAIATVAGLAQLIGRVLDHGPSDAAFHAVDAELSLGELASLYADALGVSRTTTRIGLGSALRRRDDAGYAWLVASGLFGQHYRGDRARRVLGHAPSAQLADAVREAVRGSVPAGERALQAAQ